MEELVSKTFQCIHPDEIDLSFYFSLTDATKCLKESKTAGVSQGHKPAAWKYHCFILFCFTDCIHYNDEYCININKDNLVRAY